MPVFLMYVFTKPPPRLSPGGGCIGVVILMRLGTAGGYDYQRRKLLPSFNLSLGRRRVWCGCGFVNMQ